MVSALLDPGIFDVEGYHEVAAAVAKVRAAIDDETVIITPQLLLTEESFRALR